MRKLILISASILFGSTAYAHDGHKLEQRTGFKSEAVIVNDLRLQGIEVVNIQMIGNQAFVDAKLQGQNVKLNVDRQTGFLKQTAGTLRLDPALLSKGVVTNNIKRLQIKPNTDLKKVIDKNVVDKYRIDKLKD